MFDIHPCAYHRLELSLSSVDGLARPLAPWAGPEIPESDGIPRSNDLRVFTISVRLLPLYSFPRQEEQKTLELFLVKEGPTKSQSPSLSSSQPH